MGSMIGRCRGEIKTRIVTTKAAFNKTSTLFTSKLDVSLRKKLINKKVNKSRYRPGVAQRVPGS